MKRYQQGVLLIEALIGILIFSIGILALIAMQASAISAQSDAQVRIEAANLADRLVNKIWFNVSRANATATQTSLSGAGGFVHQPTETPAGSCNFTGTASVNPIVTDWVDDVTNNVATRLPGTTANMVSVAVDTTPTGYNKVTVSICWKAPTDAVARRHQVVTHVN
jgi:type IV pilus assembly protein PilV